MNEVNFIDVEGVIHVCHFLKMDFSFQDSFSQLMIGGFTKNLKEHASSINPIPKQNMFFDLFYKKTNNEEISLINQVQSNYMPQYFVENDIIYTIKAPHLLNAIIFNDNHVYHSINLTPFVYHISFLIYDLHRHKFLHRDIKPENVIIYQDPENQKSPVARLIDYDHSKQVIENQDPQTNMNVATISYAPPEYSTSFYSFPFDIYMMGMTIFAMATGQTPYYTIKNTDEIIKYKKANQLIPSFPLNVNPDIESFVRFLCQEKPNLRPSDNLYMTILFEKKFSFPFTNSNQIPKYHAVKKLPQVNSVGQSSVADDTQKNLLDHETLNDFCKEIFHNSSLNGYSTAKDIRKFIKNKINDLTEQIKQYSDIGNQRILENKDSPTVEDKKVLENKKQLLMEINARLATQPIVASLFYDECFQKSTYMQYSRIHNADMEKIEYTEKLPKPTILDIFRDQNENNKDDKEKDEEKMVNPYDYYYVHKGPVAVDFIENMYEDFYHFQLGYNDFEQNFMQNIIEFLNYNRQYNPYIDNDNDTSEDNSEFRYLLGQIRQTPSQDYTSFFYNSISTSPLTKATHSSISENAILQVYKELFDDDNYLTKETRQENMGYKYTLRPQNIPIYGLYPIFNFVPADPFLAIASDKEDMIYYVNTVIENTKEQIQASQYLVFRFMFMFQQLYKGENIIQDRELSSEYGRLINNNSFQIETSFVAHALRYYMEHVYNDEGAAYDKREVLLIRHITNSDGTQVVGENQQQKLQFLQTQLNNIYNKSTGMYRHYFKDVLRF